MRFLIGLFVFVLVGAPASAEERYSPWAGAEPSASAERGRLQGFVDRLNTLIDEGEKARAADPRFLRDLRGLARGYDRPWRKLALADDFGDGDFTADPAWTVTAGRYWVEGGWGLRSKVDPAAAQPQQQGKVSGRDAALAILGTILGQAAGQGEGGGPAATGVAAAAVVAKPDPKWGETPCAFVEVRPGAHVTEEEIIAWCNEKLARFKCPRYVVFVELPKTSTGKIQKFKLRDLAKDV